MEIINRNEIPTRRTLTNAELVELQDDQAIKYPVYAREHKPTPSDVFNLIFDLGNGKTGKRSTINGRVVSANRKRLALGLAKLETKCEIDPATNDYAIWVWVSIRGGIK